MIRLSSPLRSPARPVHNRPRPLGAWLGILALLVQLLVSALPMPSSAATTTLDHNLTRICSTHHPSGVPDRAPQPLHGHDQCVVCAAAQLGTSTLPPPTAIFIGRLRAAVTTTAGFGTDQFIASTPSRSHQPRGPPATF